MDNIILLLYKHIYYICLHSKLFLNTKLICILTSLSDLIDKSFAN